MATTKITAVSTAPIVLSPLLFFFSHPPISLPSCCNLQAHMSKRKPPDLTGSEMCFFQDKGSATTNQNHLPSLSSAIDMVVVVF
jgi:hypothetical protein